MPAKLTVGQELWWVPSNGRGPKFSIDGGRSVTVLKVGRVWATLSNFERINVETMLGDGRGYSSTGEAFLSRPDALDEMVRRVAWDDFRDFMRSCYRIPRRPTYEQIKAFHELIKDDPKD